MPDRLSSEEQELEHYKEIYKKLVEVLRTNSSVKFTASLRGVVYENDISGQLQFDKEQGKLISGGPRLAYLDTNVIEDLDGTEPPLFKKVPYYSIGEKSFMLGFKEYAVGDQNARFVTDRRQQPFFAGVEATRDPSSYTEEQMTIFREIIKLRNSNPEVFLQMIEALCYEYIPNYYKELKQIEEKYKPKP